MGRWQRVALTEGSFGAAAKRQNCLGSVRHGLQHIGRWNADNRYALTCQPFIALVIPNLPLLAVMRSAINLDAELGRGAIEIQHIFTNRMLAPEFDASWLALEMLPKKDLWQAHCCAEPTTFGVIVRGWIAVQLPLRQPCGLPPPHCCATGRI